MEQRGVVLIDGRRAGIVVTTVTRGSRSNTQFELQPTYEQRLAKARRWGRFIDELYRRDEFDEYRRTHPYGRSKQEPYGRGFAEGEAQRLDGPTARSIQGSLDRDPIPTDLMDRSDNEVHRLNNLREHDQRV